MLGHIPLRILSPRAPAELVDQALDRMEESGDDVHPPYWADVWPAAVALGRRLLSMQLTGKTVLELGAGVGLAGLAAARAGARVVLTDREPVALEVARRNARLNGLESAVETLLLDWFHPEVAGTFDWIIGADVLYERPLVEPLASLLETLLARGGQAWIADPERAFQHAFVQALTDHDLHSKVEKTHFFWDGQARTVTLFVVEPQRLPHTDERRG